MLRIFTIKIMILSLFIYSMSIVPVSSSRVSASESKESNQAASFSTSNIEPWGYVNSQNEFDGLLIKVAEALESETGIIIDNKLEPYPRVINRIKNGSSDFAIMFNSPQAKDYGISVGRVVNPKIVLLALKGSKKVKDLNELKSKYIGFLRGSKYGAVFDDNSNITKVPLESITQGIKMLLQNRIHAVTTTEQTFYYALKKLKISKDKITSILIVNTTSGDLYFSKASKNTHLIEPFKKALIKLNNEGVLSKIFFKNDYMPN